MLCWIDIHWIFNLPSLESIIAFKVLFKLFRLGPKTVLSLIPKDWQLQHKLLYLACLILSWLGGWGQVNIKDHLSPAKLELGLSLAIDKKHEQVFDQFYQFIELIFFSITKLVKSRFIQVKGNCPVPLGITVHSAVSLLLILRPLFSIKFKHSGFWWKFIKNLFCKFSSTRVLFNVDVGFNFTFLCLG